MADTHEEQLLSDLLGAIAREDAALDAPHLEAAVLASAAPHVPARSRRSRVWIVLPAAAAVLLAVASAVWLKPTATVRLKPDTTTGTPSVRLKPDTTTVTPTVRRRPDTTTGTPTVRLKPDTIIHTVRLTPENTPPAPGAASPLATSTIEFVPLMPITEHELTGSFQIVRVQMPSASLGALRSPLAQPNEMVEADVLLGEDGRARAIRVNANESIYPWRPR
jgi:hypothetical protein